MTGEPRIPDPETMPHLTRKSLVVHWDTASNEVWFDSSGLSVFDVQGLLDCARDLAELDLPTQTIYDTEDSEDD